MNWLRKTLVRCGALFHKQRLDAELDDELQFHIEQRTEENRAAGMPPEAARREARKRFGNWQSVREECREASGASWGEAVLRDVRFGARMLRKSPGFTAVAVLSLALGIGAATAVFSLINAIVLRSLPVANPQELRVLQWTGIDARMRSISGQFEVNGNRATAECVSPLVFLTLREKAAELADVFAFAPVRDAIVRARGEAFSGSGLIVSDNFFSALGMRPLLGRLFASEEKEPGGTQEVIISFDWWEQQFGRDMNVLGQPLTVNGTTLSIRGVLPRKFHGVVPGNPPGFFVLMTPSSPFAERAVSSPEHWWVRLMARLRPSAADAQLKALLDTAFAPLAEAQVKRPEILVQPGGGGLAYDRDAYGKPLVLMLAVVGLVLLAACANVAGLSLARGAARHHELAVRAALGAGRWRLIRQALAESLLLSLLGGALGVVIAIWGRTAISRLLGPPAQGLRYDFSLDLIVLCFALGVALVTALLSGILPAIRAGRADPLAGLKSRAALGTPRLRAGKVLVVAQIGLSLLLVSGAGLYLRTLGNLRQIDAGFETEKLLVFQLNAGLAGYNEEQIAGFYDRVQAALAAIPGVQGASLTVFPLLDNKSSSGGFTVTGRTLGLNENPQSYRLVVGETFFDTLGIPLLRGRGLRAGDTPDAPKALVVNETFARKYFPNEEALGHTINTWRAGWRIVGICADAKYQNIKDAVPPTVYIPFRQFSLRFGAYFVVRTVLPPLSLANPVRKAVAAIDPGVPVAHLTTQEDLIGGTISQERLFASLCAALAVFALVLACVGLYGLLSFNVARRRSEFGIRMAIGARPGDVARTILREAFVLAAIGIGLGLPVGLAVTRLIQSQLYGVQPHDPLTLALGIAALAGLTLVAAWLPARRAAYVAPMEALRAE